MTWKKRFDKPFRLENIAKYVFIKRIYLCLVIKLRIQTLIMLGFMLFKNYLLSRKRNEIYYYNNNLKYCALYNLIKCQRNRQKSWPRYMYPIRIGYMYRSSLFFFFGRKINHYENTLPYKRTNLISRRKKRRNQK